MLTSSAEEALENILYHDTPDVSACGKLYTRELLEQIRYPEGAFSKLDDWAQNQLGAADEDVYRCVDGYDVISVLPESLIELNQGDTIWVHYKRSPNHRIEE